MNLNINEFVEQTASHNQEMDYEATAQESARQSHLMKVYGTEVKVLSNKQIKEEIAEAKKKQKQAQDMAWLTPEYCKKKYKEMMEKSKAKEEAEKKSIQEALKVKQEEKTAVRKADQKVAEMLTSQPKEEAKEEKKAPVIHRGPERVPKSQAKVISKQIAKQQQMAFHADFGSQLGIGSQSQFLSKYANKGKGNDGKGDSR